MTKTNPDLLEFHLSYKDLEQDLHEFFDHPYDLDLVVHAPELFAGDHLLNLCSTDTTYRQKSINEMKKVIDITRQLKLYFTRCDRPVLLLTLVVLPLTPL